MFIAAPASGQGKTTVTAGIARYFSQQGLCVRVFKTGPDYLDPQILEAASGNPVVQLDLWMAGLAYCKGQLYQAAQSADLILIEGAMGLFDGKPSSADLAKAFNIPISILMDVKGMAQTAAALFKGLAEFRQDIAIAGFIANRCGSERHADLIHQALGEKTPLLAALPRRPEVQLPERHLGLVQQFESQQEIEAALQAAASWIAETPLSTLPKAISFDYQVPVQVEPLLLNKKIGVAKDAAFSFIYQANLDLLSAMGAKVHFFSPMADERVPDVDALWIPGGYPELHAEALASNKTMLNSIRQYFTAQKPILAECGGLIYCADVLTDMSGKNHNLLGLVPGRVHFRDRTGCQGMQSGEFDGGQIKGHAHHRSVLTTDCKPLVFGVRPFHPAPGEAIYQKNALTASYLHWFFPSNPVAIGNLLSKSPKEASNVA